MNYIWKEWLEQSRGKGLWLGLAMVILTSIFLLVEARSYPDALGFDAFLLSLHGMNVYLIPIFGLFLSAFSIFQERELKTSMILLTKKESYRTLLLKKSLAIHCVIISVFVVWYFVLAIFMKWFLQFHLASFLFFLGTVIVLLLIFNQIGLFLGSICNTKMQLIGAVIFTWFFFIFLIDLVFLQYVSSVSYENVKLFSWLYFLDPIHTLQLFLETSLGLFSLNNMSRLMEKMIWMQPWKFLLIDIVLWMVIFFEMSILLRSKGEKS
ncbi:ABC transporter permease [Cytobacillus praedii]|uniref:Copper ABC transporter permease n=2 Tax=Cytobacillus TaxID=2675230 RepID=A0A0Q3QTZ9_9BACI|nr:MULTISPECIES: ABC transporter permease subunit [Cytobacillus]KOP71740.1 copper ABC transporter permease [Bacillus sp. FJAT-21945]KQL21585.1 copper ABC transporter permease [Cytobacillus solani]MED3553974.1 ABC transporter permease subunit [Cytobacillus praedii]MED3571157.1 ABC transporter permease subunit [Cytobacillus praedii]TCJ05200.1 copper ABC transporter permease [Cytobacillus praedii]